MSEQSILEISLYGPMGVRLTDSYVKVYIPKCDDHLLFFQSDRDDIPLDSGCEYRVRAVVGGSNTSACHNPTEVIIVPWGRCKENHGPAMKFCHAILHLPLPDLVIGLVPDPVIITQFDVSTTPSTQQKWTTALRLVYSGFDSTMGLQLYKKGGSQPIIDTGTYPSLPDLEPEVSVDFRYMSTNLVDSDKDAADCFWHLRELFPPLGAWRAEFQSRVVNQSQDVNKPHMTSLTTGDCKSPQILFATIDDQKRLIGDRPSTETTGA